MEQLTLSVPGMTCDHCKAVVDGAVSGIEGVEKVAVDLRAKQVEVAFDPQRTGPDAIRAAIEEAGYQIAS